MGSVSENTPLNYSKIREALRQDIERLAHALLGEPKRSDPGKRGRQLRYSGGLIIELVGRKRGWWKCWSGGQGGTEIKLIQFARGCDEPAAWEWAAHYTGLQLEERRAFTPAEKRAWAERQKREREQRQAKDEAARQKDRDDGIAAARAIWAASGPIAVDLGDRYLTQARAIPAPAEGWPHEVIRYHGADRAVVFAGTTDGGALQMVQRVYLTPDGRNVLLPPDDKGRRRKKKRTRGPLDGAYVRLPGSISGPLLLAEGPENGLSGWRATGYQTFIVLGGLTRCKPPTGRVVIALRDDDAPDSPAAKAFDAWVEKCREAGVNLVVATPWAKPRGDKSDFNDVLQEAGLDAVRQRIRDAVLIGHRIVPAPPPFELPTATCSGLRLSAAGLAIIGDLGSCSARLSSAAGSRSVIPGSQ